MAGAADGVAMVRRAALLLVAVFTVATAMAPLTGAGPALAVAPRDPATPSTDRPSGHAVSEHAATGAAGRAANDAAFDAVARLDELTSDHATLFRLYWAFFGRQPDAGGALYWIGQRDRCVGLDAIADHFVASEEFAARYGDVDDEAFVEIVYHNVLDRASDPGGLAYWSGLLNRAVLSRGGVVLNVSLSGEFRGRHPYPSDGVPARSCVLADGRAAGRPVELLHGEALATVAGITIHAPSAVVERAGFHQASHPGAQPMTAVDPSPVRVTTMASRNRGTDRRSAIDIVTEPATPITAPVSGTIARAGGYRLYCRYRDEYLVINPDEAPQLEVKVLHVQRVSVRAGQRVEAGDVVAAHATTFPFRSQIDALTAEPSWPHVHIEVVDPSVPSRSRGGC